MPGMATVAYRPIFYIKYVFGHADHVEEVRSNQNIMYLDVPTLRVVRKSNQNIHVL
jgi:hypothetical protein